MVVELPLNLTVVISLIPLRVYFQHVALRNTMSRTDLFIFFSKE